MPPGPPFAPRFGSCVGSLCGTVARATRRRGARSGPSGGEAAAMVLRRLARRVRPGSASPRTGGSAPRRHRRAAQVRFAFFRSRRARTSSPGGAPRLVRPCALRVLSPRVPLPQRVRPARAPFPLRGGAVPRPSGAPWLPALLGGAPSLPRGEPFVRLASSRPCALRVLLPRVPWPWRVRPALAPFLLHGGAALPPSAVAWPPGLLGGVLSSRRGSSAQF